jgi:HEAT repeat protein
LGRIGNSTITPYIIQATKDTDAEVRLRAIKALGKIGGEDEIISVLNRCSQDEDSVVRVRAREELDKMKRDEE